MFKKFWYSIDCTVLILGNSRLPFGVPMCWLRSHATCCIAEEARTRAPEVPVCQSPFQTLGQRGGFRRLAIVPSFVSLGFGVGSDAVIRPHPRAIGSR